MKKIFLPVLVLLFSALACNLGGGIPTAPPSGGTPVLPTVPASPPPAPELTADMLRNATYDISDFYGSPYTVTLTNGEYASGSDPLAAGYVRVTLGEQIAFGDLNYDGVNDAAVILAINGGGSEVFVYLEAVLNAGGAPLHTASMFIDDRPIINALAITAGEVLLQSVLHGPDDPLCCPNMPVEQGYRLYNVHQLVLTRWAETTPGGLPRHINIASPADLTSVSAPFTLAGSVTIGPFENTLNYNIYDEENALLDSGWVMTDSPNPGDPGNFSLPLDLTAYGRHGRLRVEIVEYSMADGSVLTLDSVLVIAP